MGQLLCIFIPQSRYCPNSVEAHVIIGIPTCHAQHPKPPPPQRRCRWLLHRYLLLRCFTAAAAVKLNVEGLLPAVGVGEALRAGDAHRFPTRQQSAGCQQSQSSRLTPWALTARLLRNRPYTLGVLPLGAAGASRLTRAGRFF